MTLPVVAQSLNGTIATGDTLTLTSWTPDPDDLLIVCVHVEQDGVTPTVAGNGLTWVEDDSMTGGTQNVWRFIAQGAAPTSGSVVVTVTGSTQAVVALACRVAGTDAGGTNGSDAVEGEAQGAATSDSMQLAVVTTGADRLIVGFGGYPFDPVFTVPGDEDALQLNVQETVISSSLWTLDATVAGTHTIGAASDLDTATDWHMLAVALVPAPPGPEPTFDGDPDIALTGATDVSITLFNPDWTRAGEVYDFDAFELSEWDDGTQHAAWKMPLEDLVELGLYDTGCKQCPVEITIRDLGVRFTGIVTVCDDEDRDGGGETLDDVTADVKIEAVTDVQYHTSGREVKGTGGLGRYDPGATIAPDDAMRLLIDANCKTGSTATYTPAAYATVGTSAVGRDNFGAHNVQASTPSTHPDTFPSIRWDTGDSLWHAIAEGCRRYDLYVSGSWNKTASPKPLLTIAVNYPRQGTDRTATVKFDRESGTLMTFKRKVDHLKNANLADVHGKGFRGNQVHGYAIHQADYDDGGLRETGDLWPSGWANDVAEEAEFVIAQAGGSETVYEAKAREGFGLVVGVDFDLRDKVTISDSVRGVVVQDYVSSLKWTLSGAGPLNVEIGFGRPEQTVGGRAGRSGGGRSGAGRKGQKPKEKGGQPESFREIGGDSGIDVTAEDPNDQIDFIGDSGTRIRTHFTGISDPVADTTPGQMAVPVYGNWNATCPTCNGYVLVWDPVLGRDIMLLARDPGLGGPEGGDLPGAGP